MQLGYLNVYRDPLGYPEWRGKNLPVDTKLAGLSDMESQKDEPGPLSGMAMIWTLLGIFAGGMALNLTPCVYPLIPITISYFGGKNDKRQVIGHGLCYIGGLSVTNSVLGVVAALTGSLMGAMLQNPLVLTILAIVLVLLAANMFGVWELHLPSALIQAASKSYAGYFGSVFMGMAIGVVAAPCIGPFVLGLLVWVAGTGSPWVGFIVFFTLSLGLGLPLFFLAIFSGQLSRLPRSGEWMLWVRKLLGWVLVLMAVYYITPLLPKAAGPLFQVIAAAAAGLHLGWIERTRTGSLSFEWIKTVTGIAALVVATVMIGNWLSQGGGVTWHPYSDRLLTVSKNAGRPVIIDFSADWCAPCRKLDKITFRHPDVVKQSERRLTFIKVDMTKGGNPIHQRLINKYKVKGVPTIVILDEQGNERTDLRLLDFIPPHQFLNHITPILKPAKVP